MRETTTSSGSALSELLAQRVAHELSDTELLGWVVQARAHDRRHELQVWLAEGAPNAAFSTERVLETTEMLAARGFLEEALALSEHAAQDARMAGSRADWAMQLARYEIALGAADIAIAGLLHDGLSVEDFVRLSARGAPAEGLLRYARGAVARLRPLHEPLAIRWEALHRLRRTRDAQLMRNVCLQHFSERASVWASAGNHALDDGNLDLAERYFMHCLKLDRDWTAALAGLAIVRESKKDWARALVFRERVVTLERALERDDPPSLQRSMRYAAALARCQRWHEAEVLFRRCLRRGAYTSLPAERAVLLRVFSRELYAPALIAECLQLARPEELDQPVRLAEHEAGVIAQLARGFSDHAALGMCAWLAGDAEHAYRHFDEAEQGAGDLAAQYLLLCAAEAFGSDELPSIAEFCERAARAALARSSEVSDDSLLYALLTVTRGRRGDAPARCARSDGLLALYHAACAGADEELAVESGPPLQQLRRVVAFRATQLALGHSPLLAAALSSAALAASLEVP